MCRAAALLVLGACATSEALAAPNDILVLPTEPRVEQGKGAEAEAHLGKTQSVARRMDAVIGEAVQDLGLALERASDPRRPEGISERALVSQASDRWVMAPSVQRHRKQWEIRVQVVAPGSKVILVRGETTTTEELEIQVMRMVRELIEVGKPGSVERLPTPSKGQPATQTRSPGRAILALNGVMVGALAGYALQRASSSDDARLVYPLAALGAGIGLGGPMIVADEWEIGLGDAWYLSAGSLWGGASGLLFSEGYNAQPVTVRALHGLLGAMVGLTAGTVSISLRRATEGGAAMAHSGGAYGALFGALGQGLVEGKDVGTPARGMAWGTAAGVLLSGSLATFTDVTSSRVLLIDLVAGLGGLTGAAVASPLVFGNTVSEGQNRVWLSSVALGTVLGTGVGIWVTRPKKSTLPTPAPLTTPLTTPLALRRSEPAFLPYAGAVGEPPGPGLQAPLGIGIRGSF